MVKYKKPLLFALCLLPAAVIAGIFVGYYQLAILSDEVIAEVIAQIGNADLLILISAVQCAGYCLFCGFFGYILSDKLGLWKPIRFERSKLTVTLFVSVVGGIVLSLDYWAFGSIIDGVQTATAAGLTASGLLASVLYGGIIEEVMLRLFCMSLLAWIIWKVFYRKQSRETIPSKVFIVANIIAALLFAAGHLPATVATFGRLTAPIVFRCFLFNGAFGLLFGRLYRKYGIAYSMVSHTACHIVSKLIWYIFI